MNTQFGTLSVEVVQSAVDGLEGERRIVHCESDVQWYPELLRRISEHA